MVVAYGIDETCSDIKYPNVPWNAGDGFKRIQPYCWLSFPNELIPAEDVKVKLKFDDDDAVVQNVVVSK